MPRAGQATRRPGRAAAAGRRRVKKEQKRKIAQNNTDLPAPRRRSHGVPVQHDIQRQGTQLRHDGKQRKQKWIAFIKPAHEPASRKPAQAETALKRPKAVERPPHGHRVTTTAFHGRCLIKNKTPADVGKTQAGVISTSGSRGTPSPR